MKKYLFLSLALLLPAFLFAQTTERQVVSTAGGTYYNNSTNFVMDYTLGEVAIATISNSSVIFTQGFQQPYIDFSTLVPKISESSIGLTIYPNPVKELLHISIDKPETGTYRLQLYDILGKLMANITVNSEKATALKTVIDFRPFTTGHYFLRILQENKEVKTMKIIKIN